MNRLFRFASLMAHKYGQNRPLKLREEDLDPDALKQEAEEELKKRFEKSQDHNREELKALVRKGIIPVIAPRADDPYYPEAITETAHLGSGMYSEALEVSYHGKLAVAKLTRSKKDFEAPLKLEALRNKIGEYAKHLPNILEHFILEPQDNYQKPYVLIVEKLQPISSHIKKALFDVAANTSPDVKEKIDFHSLIEKIAQSTKTLCTNFNSDYNVPEIQKIVVEIKSTLPEKIVDIFMAAFKNTTSFDQFELSFYAKMDALRDYFKAKCGEDRIFDKIERLINNISYSVMRFTEPSSNLRWPVYPDAGTQSKAVKYFEGQPESQSLIQFLLLLHNKFGITWGDLHQNNIMQRPSTGDLIISDPGLFEGIYK
jgi:hypothetical protein